VVSVRLVVLIFGIVSVAMYLCAAVWSGRSPDLPAALVIFMSTVSLLGAARLVGLALTSQFERNAARHPDEALTNLTPEDVALFIVGGIALAWISIEGMAAAFARILE
jgi:hypothetical protein